MASINPAAGEVAGKLAIRAPPPPAMATVRAPPPPPATSLYSAYHPAAGSHAANAMISSASMPLLQQQQRTWQPQPTTTFFQPNLDRLPTVTAGHRFLPPPPFAHPGVLQMPTYGSYHHHHQPPLAATSGIHHHAVIPDAPPQQPPKRRRRNNAAASASITNAAQSESDQPATTARRARGRPRGGGGGGASRQQQQQPATTVPAAIVPHHNDVVNQVDIAGGDGEAATSALAIVPRHEHDDVTSDQQVVIQYADTDSPGVRFRPTDQELIIHFLRQKYILRDQMPTNIVNQFDVCKLNLDQLHGDLGLGESLDGSWYVFSPRSRYYEHGSRPARGINTKTVGYWKSNSAEADVIDDGKVIGRVNTLTLALGHQPNGVSTHWRMKEYRIPEFQIPPGQDSTQLLDEWVLCKLYQSYAYKQKGKGKVHEEASKPDDVVEDLSVVEYDIRDKPDGVVQGMSVDEYGIHDKPDGGVQDLSIYDYDICDISLAAKYEDPAPEETQEQNIGEISLRAFIRDDFI